MILVSIFGHISSSRKVIPQIDESIKSSINQSLGKNLDRFQCRNGVYDNALKKCIVIGETKDSSLGMN